jgi:alkenylglycerophosphocholine/alkenylglycerophosphoethanolamine hydrolase
MAGWVVYGVGVAAWFAASEAGLDGPPHYALKAVPVLALIGVVLSGKRDAHGLAVAAGLVLSVVGDVVIELEFLAGVGAFLLAHVAYIVAWTLVERAPKPLLVLPFAAWVVAVRLFLGDGLGDMAIPVSVYMVVICAMMWRAAARISGPPAADAAWLAAIGSAVFGLSDSLIALNKFHAPFWGADTAIMLTYWAGQALIAASARK